MLLTVVMPALLILLDAMMIILSSITMRIMLRIVRCLLLSLVVIVELPKPDLLTDYFAPRTLGKFIHIIQV